jgi:hypothetical protein
VIGESKAAATDSMQMILGLIRSRLFSYQRSSAEICGEEVWLNAAR